MHITARNYAAQCADSLRQQVKSVSNMTIGADVTSVAGLYENLSSVVQNSIHFALPDGGTIFNDRLKGMEGQNIRLPFSGITVEWFMPNGPLSSDEELISNKKRLVLAYEGPNPIKSHCQGVCFISFYFVYAHNVWAPEPIYFFIPKDVAIPNQENFPNGELGLDTECGIWMPSVYEHMYGAKAKDGVCKAAIHNTLINILCALELLEALSCSNVSHEPIETIDPRKNAKRIKAGKLPIYETRILTIDSGKSSQSGMAQGGTHASPRQHLRRGHIRRLSDKNVWVNSCVVGRAEHGVIEKQYYVQ
jgi:hypothetical protein